MNEKQTEKTFYIGIRLDKIAYNALTARAEKNRRSRAAELLVIAESELSK